MWTGGFRVQKSSATADVLFAEPGARWRTVVYGPLFCLIVLIIELSSGRDVHWPILAMFAAILAGIISVQVMAARQHISVELSATSLRNGSETVPLDSIVEVLGEWVPGRPQPWETARVLGELAEVPRRRTAVGLRLTDDSVVRAWARDDRGLRGALTAALDDATLDVTEGDE